jgi:hypothetical protein
VLLVPPAVEHPPERPAEPEPEHPGSHLFERIGKSKYAKILMRLASALYLAGGVGMVTRGLMEGGSPAMPKRAEPQPYSRDAHIEMTAQSYEDRIKQLRTIVGDQYVDTMMNPPEVEMKPGGPELINEERLGMTEAQLRGYLATALPASYAENIAQIGFITPEEQEKIGFGTEYAGIASADYRAIMVRIPKDFTRGDAEFIIQYVLVHEAAHLNDFKSNKHLTPELRAELFEEVLERLNAPDRLQTAYLKLLEKKEGMDVARLASEYYAEAVSVYLSAPYSMSVADRDLVARVFLYTDPGTASDNIRQMEKNRYAFSQDVEQHLPPTP